MSLNPIQFIQRIAVVTAALVMCACATPTKMAYGPDAPAPDINNGQVLLLSATVKNDYRPSWQPDVRFVSVERFDAKEAADRLNFLMDDPGRTETPSGNDYFMRLDLKNGKYILRGMTGFSVGFPIMGNFFVPLHFNIDVKENGVFYVGHIDAVIRERKGDEFRAGPLIPLVDQAVTGFATGTFDVNVTDRFDSDVVAFRKRFPALANMQIKKAILPAFDRKVAQEWWDAH